MNRVVWPIIIAFIIYPCIPLSSAADPILPVYVSLESGTDEVFNSGSFLLAGRDYRDRYERKRKIRKDIRKHYRKEQRKAALAGAIIGGVVVGSIVAERDRRRRAFYAR
jgi:hypothetical protein